MTTRAELVCIRSFAYKDEDTGVERIFTANLSCVDPDHGAARLFPENFDSAPIRPQGQLRGPAKFQLLGRDLVERYRSSGDDPDELRQADELVLVFGLTDEAQRPWSFFVDGAAFRTAIADGFGDDGHPLDLTEHILLFLGGWPENWEAEERRDREFDRKMALAKERDHPEKEEPEQARQIRGFVAFMPGTPEIANVAGFDETGRLWTLRMSAAEYRALQRAELERKRQRNLREPSGESVTA